MGLCPCKGCQDRSVGCHAKCDSYKEWKREVDDIRVKKQEAKLLNDALHPKKKIVTKRRKRT